MSTTSICPESLLGDSPHFPATDADLTPRNPIYVHHFFLACLERCRAWEIASFVVDSSRSYATIMSWESAIRSYQLLRCGRRHTPHRSASMTTVQHSVSELQGFFRAKHVFFDKAGVACPPPAGIRNASNAKSSCQFPKRTQAGAMPVLLPAILSHHHDSRS